MKCPFCKQHPISVAVLQPEGDNLLELGLCEFCAKKFMLFEGACPSIQVLAERLETGQPPEAGAGAGAGAFGLAKPAKGSGQTAAVGSSSGAAPTPLVVPTSLADKLKGFQKTGRLAGPDDYQDMEPQLIMLFRKIQGGARHKGKIPRVQQAVLASKDRLSELEIRLAAAVAAESYEKAAELRDEIKRCRAQLAAEMAAANAAGSPAPDDAAGEGDRDAAPPPTETP